MNSGWGFLQAWGLCEFGHQGLMHDEEIDLVYNRARALHPGLGRFVQRDPLDYADESSLYAYCRAVPNLLIDAEGTCSVCGTWNMWEGDASTVDSIAAGSTPGTNLLKKGMAALDPNIPLHGGGAYAWQNSQGMWRGYYAFWTFINVCETASPCEIKVKEDGTQTDYLGKNAVATHPLHYEGGTTLERAKADIVTGECDTWIVVFDAPGSTITKFGTRVLGWGMVFDRTLSVVDSKSQQTVFERTLHVDFGQVPNGTTGSTSGGQILSWKR
jgi:RHS repeat-associated protein